MYSRLLHVQWAITYAVGPYMYRRLLHVQWALTYQQALIHTVGSYMCSRLLHVQQVLTCTVGSNMYSRLCHTHLTRLPVVRDNTSSSTHISSEQSLRDYASTSSFTFSLSRWQQAQRETSLVRTAMSYMTEGARPLLLGIMKISLKNSENVRVARK